MEAEQGISIIDADGVKISNLDLKTLKEPAMELYNTRNCVIENFSTNTVTPATITINGNESGNIKFVSSSLHNYKSLTKVGSEVKNGEVKFE